MSSKLASLVTLNVITSKEHELLMHVEEEDGLFQSNVQGVFDAIKALAQIIMDDDNHIDIIGFNLIDRQGDMNKYREKKQTFRSALTKRKFSLNGTNLEYNSKKKGKIHLINLRVDCFCCESPLGKHAFFLFTPKRVLHLSCNSFTEKMMWVSSIARAILVPRRKHFGMPTLLPSPIVPLNELNGDAEILKKLSSGSIVINSNVIMKNKLRYIALRSHYLMYWLDQKTFEQDKPQLGFLYLPHNLQIVNRGAKLLELKEGANVLVQLDFIDPQICADWKRVLQTSVDSFRFYLTKYAKYFEDVPTEQKRKSSTTTSAATVSIPPRPPQVHIQSVKYGDDDEEVDSRPCIKLRFNVLLVPLRVNSLSEPLIRVRAEIYKQLQPEMIPIFFSFSKKNVPLATTQESSTTLESFLDEEQILNLHYPKNIVNPAQDWEAERNAYLNLIQHLEAQIAELREALFLKTTSPDEDETTTLRRALMTLQKDGFINADINLPELEMEYLKCFNPIDAVNAFAGSLSSPLRVVWRKLCGSPEKMLDYIQNLEKFVLVPYKIRKERLISPFWANSVLRDPRFMEDPTRFQEWAKEEPWCRDDQERYIYLTTKLLNITGHSDDYQILLKRDTISEVKAQFQESRPKSFLISQEAQNAMKSFMKRKSERGLITGEGSFRQEEVVKKVKENDIPPPLQDNSILEEEEEEESKDNNHNEEVIEVKKQMPTIGEDIPMNHDHLNVVVMKEEEEKEGFQEEEEVFQQKQHIVENKLDEELL